MHRHWTCGPRQTSVAAVWAAGRRRPARPVTRRRQVAAATHHTTWRGGRRIARRAARPAGGHTSRHAGASWLAARPGEPGRVGFISLYTLSYAGGALLFLAPLLVSLALKVNDLVGIDDAPRNLALVTGVGSLLAIVSNPLFGRLSDRTTARMGMRRPWMLVGLAGGTIGILTVALAPNIGVVLLGWCIAQVFLNALLAAQTAVLPDQVPRSQRGIVSGVLGICLPVASVAGTYLVQPSTAPS